MTSTLFLVFVILTAVALVALIGRYLGSRTARGVTLGLGAWFSYAGLMGYFGLIGNTGMRPPGVVFILVPVVAFLLFFIVRMSTASFPLWLVLAAQSFRVVVELFIHQLWVDGLVPRMLTFEGANVDIFIGVSAPLAAWLSTRGRNGLKLALGWNVLGLLSLANVVTRAVLTTPGPLHLIHAEVPNRMIGTFPFTFIPAFFVPLAVILHVVGIRGIPGRLRAKSVTIHD